MFWPRNGKDTRVMSNFPGVTPFALVMPQRPARLVTLNFLKNAAILLSGIATSTCLAVRFAVLSMRALPFFVSVTW